VEAILKDITERKELETQLQQVQRIEAVGTLAGGIAHDFIIILTALRGSLDLCMLAGQDESPLKKNSPMDSATSRAADLTRQLLLFSRKQPMETRPIDLNASVENILKIVERIIGEDISRETSLSEDLWSVMADKGSIEQVIMNLMINARDAMPAGGTITLRTETRQRRVILQKPTPMPGPGSTYAFTTRTTGTGMDSSTIRHIFERSSPPRRSAREQTRACR
jgi:signal transduction histidine kinase